MPDPMATFVAEYPCERRCQVELDLAQISVRFTHRQMLVACDAAHARAHAQTEKVFQARPEVVVRAAVMAGAS